MGIKIFDFLSKEIDQAQLDELSITLAEKIHFKNLALHIAISYIANTLSKCEIKTFENGEEVRGQLYYMLNVNPNPNQNSSQFMNKLVETYYYKGDALCVPFEKKGTVYVADSFSLEEMPLKENVFSNVSIEGDTLKKRYKSSEVFHFKLDDVRVKRLVDDLYCEYGTMMAAAIESFRRGNSEKYKLILENVQAGDPTFAKQFNEVIKKQLDTFLNSDKAVYPQFRGQNLERMEVGGPATSGDVIALRKEIFEVVGQAMKIPMSMMYGNITNMNEIVKVYLSICIDPLAQMISEELTRKMYPYEKWSKGYRVKVDTSRVNHMSILEVADKADKAIASGIANIDDMRTLFDMEPIGTDYSTAHFITKNYAPADKALDLMEGGDSIE